MGKKFSPTLVGLFVVGALALAVTGVAVFGSGTFFRDVTKFVVFFDGSVNGLRIGAPVKFKGVQIGQVADIRLRLGKSFVEQLSAPTIPVIIELDNELIRAQGGMVAVDDPAQVKQLIDRGLRAQLSSESFVTGLLYVSLDAFPNDPPRFVGGKNLPYPELPSVATTFEQAQSAAAEIIAKLKEMKLEDMIDDLRQAAKGINELVNSPGLRAGVDAFGEVMANADKALIDVRGAVEKLGKLGTDLDASLSEVKTELVSTTKEAQRTLEQATLSMRNVSALTQPEAPLVQQLGETMNDLSQASRQLRNFLDYLERNPGALIRGKSLSGEK